MGRMILDKAKPVVEQEGKFTCRNGSRFDIYFIKDSFSCGQKNVENRFELNFRS